MSFQQIQNYERGKNRLSAATMMQTAALANVDLHRRVVGAFSIRNEADFQVWRHQRDLAAWKYAMWDAGLKPPTQPATGRSKCFCGADLTIARDRSRSLCKSGNGPMKFTLDRADADANGALAAGSAGTLRCSTLHAALRRTTLHAALRCTTLHAALRRATLDATLRRATLDLSE
jgi:hypothetical protein